MRERQHAIAKTAALEPLRWAQDGHIYDVIAQTWVKMGETTVEKGSRQ